MKILYKFILIFVIISQLSILGIGYLGYHTGSSIINTHIKKKFLDEVKILANQIDFILFSDYQRITTIAEDIHLAIQDNLTETEKKEKIKEKLLHHKKENTNILSISFFDISGKFVAGTNKIDSDKKYIDFDFWDDISFGRISVAKDIRSVNISKLPIYYLAASVYSKGGKIIGYIVAQSSFTKIYNFIFNFKNKYTNIVLADKNENIIFSTFKNYGKVFDIDLNGIEKKISNSAKDTGLFLANPAIKDGIFEIENKEYGKAVVAYVEEKGYEEFIGNEWKVFLFKEKNNLFDSLIKYQRQIGIFSVLFLLFSIILGIFFGNILINPLIKLSVLAKLVSGGKIKERAEIKTKDEIGSLAGSFNNMLDSIEKNQQELREKLEELEKFQELTVGREFKMVELKKEIEKIKEELNKKNA